MFIETTLLANNDEEAWSMFNSLSEAEEKDLEFNFIKGKYFLKNLNFHAALATIFSPCRTLPAARAILPQKA